MANFNKVILAGNLTRDPELRYTPEGTPVTSFDLAINSFYTDKAGEKQQDATFIPVTVWRKQAESVGEFLKKGSGVLVEGRLRQEKWEKDGQKRSRLVCVASIVRFLERKPGPSEPPQPDENLDDPAQGG